MKFFPILLIVLVSSLLVIGCSNTSTDVNNGQGPVHLDELNAELTDQRLLRKLGVEGVVLLDVEPYRVTITEVGTAEPIGELHYTIQDGWHLNAENEILEFISGEGWIIAEQ